MTDERVEWHCVADLMAVLMVIFLFISVVYLIGNIETQQQKESLEQENRELERKDSARIEFYEKIKAYRNHNEELQKAIICEFRNDLRKWNAEILEDNSIRFNSPDTLFETGKSEMTVRFKKILNDFFPRYVRVLVDFRGKIKGICINPISGYSIGPVAFQEQTKVISINPISDYSIGPVVFQEQIIEIRIEGHTSSVWKKVTTYDEIFLNNSKLSQQRAHAVLDHSYKTDLQHKHKKWLTKKLRANGLAFAKPIFVDGSKEEDAERSKRVEFRVITEEIDVADAFTGKITQESEQ